MSAPVAAPPPPRRRKSGALVVVIVVVLTVLVGLPLIFCAVLSAKPPKISKGTVISLRIDGDIPEAPSTNPFAKLAQQQQGTLSLHEMRTLVRAAKDDARVAGVLLQIGPIGSGMATVDELRGLIGELREAKKPVQALLLSDFVDEKSYYLATAADRIVLTPEAGVLLNGFTGEVEFWRGTLEKLHVEPQVIMYHEYKSAGEPFANREMSKYFEEWLQAVLDEFYGSVVKATADRRGVDEKTVRDLFDRGGMTAKEALEAKLVDALGYYDEVEEAIRSAAAPDVKEPHVVGGSRYLLSKRGFGASGDRIAVIYATGPITASADGGGLFGGDVISGPALSKTIRQARNDKSIKAIVMRVNSPGGSAVGSDLIRREIELVKKAGKPFVVSMSTVAGSGGYWIAMDADSIVAQPTTLTGSIGVVFTKFNILGFYRWIGANVDGVQVGKNADILSPFESMDAQQQTAIKGWMDAVYDDFVVHVAKGRGLTPEEAHPLAKGRVWTGAQAKANKLVDELGSLDTAIGIAKQKANLTGEHQLVVFPKEKTFFEALAEMGNASSPSVEIEAALEELKRELETPTVQVLSPTITLR